MLENKKNQKKTVFGGIGVALLLCALMVLMPMSGYVDNNEATVESVEADPAGEEGVAKAAPLAFSPSSLLNHCNALNGGRRVEHRSLTKAQHDP